MNRKTLGFILSSLQGQEVVVELKNDFELRGVIEEGDWGLNLVLRGVSQTNTSGQLQKFDSLMVSGKTIRFVHIPSYINVRKSVAQYSKILQKISKSSKPHKIKG